MKDYGADPLGDGTFRMVPSGDIVDLEERNRRLVDCIPSLASPMSPVELQIYLQKHHPDWLLQPMRKKK